MVVGGGVAAVPLHPIHGPVHTAAGRAHGADGATVGASSLVLIPGGRLLAAGDVHNG